jgi:hypothetical protein
MSFEREQSLSYFDIIKDLSFLTNYIHECVCFPSLSVIYVFLSFFHLNNISEYLFTFEIRFYNNVEKLKILFEKTAKNISFWESTDGGVLVKIHLFF